MAALNIILWFLLYITIPYGHTQLIDRNQLRESLKNKRDNPLCSCYDTSLTNISPLPNSNAFCYTYSIKYNHNINICHNNAATNIIFGICNHETPRFSSRKLRKSLLSISPNNYHAKSMKLHRSSMLGINIQNDLNIFNTSTEQEITLCLKNINSDGVTSDNMQYISHNGDVISCKSHANHNGLPCRTNQRIISEPTPKPTKYPSSTDPNNDSNEYHIVSTWAIPSKTPTNAPTKPSTNAPTNIPTFSPTTNTPTFSPTTNTPTFSPTTNAPTMPTYPTTSAYPTPEPTAKPTYVPIDDDNDNDNHNQNQLNTNDFDICVDKISLLQNLDLTITKHKSLPVMTMQMIGPFDKWFAFGFGEFVMQNSYAISVENAAFNVFERILPASNNVNNISSHFMDTSSWNVNDIQMNELNGQRIVTITRPWNTIQNTYDFTSFFQCNIDSLPIITAIGNGLHMTYHSIQKAANISNECGCDGNNNNQAVSETLSSTSTPLVTIANNAPILSDICIVFDQSCNLDDDECTLYFEWISEFVISIDDGTGQITERICLLGVSQGIQILITLNQENDIIKISQIIREQTCGDSKTNLYDALEVAELQFDSISPSAQRRSIVIFSNCMSTNNADEYDQNDICVNFNPQQINVNIYVVNIQSIDGTLAGNKSDINATYLSCLTDNNHNRMVMIDDHNYNNAQNIMHTISDEIKNVQNDDDDINDAKSDLSNVIGNVIKMDDNDALVIGHNNHKGFSASTRHMIQYVFIFTIVCICLNALCCTVCALRQSGALDPCFGEIDIEVSTDSDGDSVFINDSLSELNNMNNIDEINDMDVDDNNAVSDATDMTHMTDDESFNLFDDDEIYVNDKRIEYVNLNSNQTQNSYFDETPPIPASITSVESIHDNIDESKMNQYLNSKQTRKDFDKFFVQQNNV